MSSTSNNTDGEIKEIAISFTVRFWIYLCLLVPSLASSIFALFHIFRNRHLRSAPKNHVTIILLFLAVFCQLTIYPGMIHFYQLNGVWDRPLALCIIWSYIEYTAYLTQINLMTLASIQRHVIIFHERWMATKIRRLCVHYVPIMLVFTYSLIINAVIFFFPSCGEVFSINFASGATSCMWYEDTVFIYYDSIVHQILPVLILTLSNVMLLARVVWKKHHMEQRVQWRKHRKMAVQFFLISSIYIICVAPYALLTIFYYVGIVTAAFPLFEDVAVLMSYFPGFLLSIICSLVLPEIRVKLWRILRCGRHTVVSPMADQTLTARNNTRIN